MKTLLFFCTMFILLLSSCGLFEDDEGPFNPLSEEFKSYVYFPAGSYWIYKELGSGRLDSSYIINSQIRVKHNPKKGGGPERYESMGMQIVREIMPGRRDTIIGLGAPSPLSFDNSYYNGIVRNSYEEIIYKYGVGGHPYFATPVDTGNDNDFFRLDIFTVQESMEIQGVHYHDVVTTLHGDPNDLEGNNPIKSEIYAKDVGVIRREYYDGRVYELLRHHIAE
ncbi:MAG: hypothetical protein WD077_05060 [Bacteroidia bacterium]